MAKLHGILALTLAVLVMAWGSTPARAGTQAERPLSLVLSAGGEYDSNVAVEQTDAILRKGDGRAVLATEARYTIRPTGKLAVTAGYAFEQSLHRKFSAFDLQTHTLSLGAEQHLGPVALAADYSFTHVLLGGAGFLDIHQISPSLSGFAGKALYLRGSFTYVDKNFRSANAFDARNYQFGADAYQFMMGSRAYLSASARYEVERTTGPELAYKGVQLGTRLQLPIRAARVRLGYTWRERHYDTVTASIGARRRERRSAFSLTADIPVRGALKFKPELRLIDRSSNYLLADYRETVAAAGFSYQF